MEKNMTKIQNKAAEVENKNLTELVKNIDKQIGEKIQIHRKLRNKSIDFLAKKLGRSYQQIQNYESGKHRIASSSLFVAAQALKFPIANFFPNGKVGKEEKVE